MRDGVIVLDPEGEIIDFNPAASLILGNAAPEVLKERMEEMLRKAGVDAKGSPSHWKSIARSEWERERASGSSTCSLPPWARRD
jgi:PAS domain-containing protein